MDYLLITIALLLLILGLLGCFLPVLPGPPLSFISLLLISFTRWGDFSKSLLIWTGIAAVVVTLLDYILPVWTTKKIGGSSRGIWGATIGLAVGLFLFPPYGIIAGPFVGAYIGEITSKNSKDKAFRSAVGSFIGFLAGTGLKFAISGIITYYFVVEVFIR